MAWFFVWPTRCSLDNIFHFPWNVYYCCEISSCTFMYFLKPVLFVSQSAFVKGHKRTPSDIEFRELTRLDAQSAMNKELSKLAATAPPGLQEVGVLHWRFSWVYMYWLISLWPRPSVGKRSSWVRRVRSDWLLCDQGLQQVSMTVGLDVHVLTGLWPRTSAGEHGI